MGDSSGKNEYKFTLMKSGLHPEEFKESLRCKVKKLLESFKIKEKKTLTTTVNEVTKEVCLRVNKTNPYTLDLRCTSTTSYIGEKILESPNDTPRRKVKSTSGRQGTTRADKAWKKQYHSEQHTLFSLPFVRGKLFCQSPQIILKHNKKGYLFEESGRELTANEFSCAIDQITVDLGKELSILRRGMQDTNYSNKWKVRLNSISTSCKKILMRRLALDWAVDNDLMDITSYEIWRDHVKVVITFAALWVVVRTMVDRLAEGWGPDPQLSGTGNKAIIPVLFLVMVLGIEVSLRALFHR